jgi:PBP1b-binding outer membrane lipoprotein LpoB
MKRLVTLMIVGTMAILLAGCGQQAPKQTDVKPETTTTTETTVSEPAAQPAPEAVKPAEEQGAPAATQE